MKKITLLMSLLLTVGIFKTQAQEFDKENLSIGVGIGAYYYSAYSKPININLRANYVLDEKSAIVVGFNYHLPFEIKNNMTANAMSSITSPQSVDVTRTDKYTMFNIMANYYYTFVNENTDPFSLHAIVGAGLTRATITESFTEYDNSLYNINRYSSDNSHMGPIIDLGIGSNINLDKINIFIDAKMGIPATNTSNNNSTQSNFENPIPFHVSLNAGVRYSIFE
jgi:hypothetical protein